MLVLSHEKDHDSPEYPLQGTVLVISQNVYRAVIVEGDAKDLQKIFISSSTFHFIFNFTPTKYPGD
jgi:hypothetical protein